MNKREKQTTEKLCGRHTQKKTEKKTERKKAKQPPTTIKKKKAIHRHKKCTHPNPNPETRRNSEARRRQLGEAYKQQTAPLVRVLQIYIYI